MAERPTGKATRQERPARPVAKGGPPELPENALQQALIRNARVIRTAPVDVPWNALRLGHPRQPRRVQGRQSATASKLHPQVRALQAGERARLGGLRQLGRRSREKRFRLIVLFRDELVLPRFPGMYADSGTERQYRAAVRQAERLIAEIASERAREYTHLARCLRRDCGAKVVHCFWLIQAALVDVAASKIDRLLALPGVLAIEAQYSDAMLPMPPTPGGNDDPVRGRRFVRSDAYRAVVGARRHPVGLIDSGIRRTHQLLSAPNRIGTWADCVNSPDCTGSLPYDSRVDGHGTRSAAIIAGNRNFGDAFRGVSDHRLDSLKATDNRGWFDLAAAIFAFETAIRRLDQVIVASIAGVPRTVQDVLSRAAERAYDAGAVVVAAVGNNGPTRRSHAAPAASPLVLGIGARDLQSGRTPSYQSRGPTADGRIKPDVQMPTDSETADNTADDGFSRFGGTSEAVAWAGGTAALVRSWLSDVSPFPIHPGHVYAYMILAGDSPRPQNRFGAGLVQLPVNGHVWWGHWQLGNRATVDLALLVGQGARQLDAAIWWPELPQPYHNLVTLQLIDPAGVMQARSLHPHSVFQKARIGGTPLQAGGWTLRLQTPAVIQGLQSVFIAASLQ